MYSISGEICEASEVLSLVTYECIYTINETVLAHLGWTHPILKALRLNFPMDKILLLLSVHYVYWIVALHIETAFACSSQWGSQREVSVYFICKM